MLLWHNAHYGAGSFEHCQRAAAGLGTRRNAKIHSDAAHLLEERQHNIYVYIPTFAVFGNCDNKKCTERCGRLLTNPKKRPEASQILFS